MPRKALVAGGIFAAALILFTSAAMASDVGKRFPPEMRTFVDATTGVTVTALTTGTFNDAKFYQTHPQWTSDGKYLVFRSNRGAGGRGGAFAVSVTTGEIIQLTDGGANVGSVARKSNKLYFFRGGMGTPSQLFELNLDPLLADSKAGTMKDPASYERAIGSIPPDLRDAGGFTLDADEKVGYIGVGKAQPGGGRGGPPPQPGQPRPPRPAMPPQPAWGGIRQIDLQTGAVTKVVDVPFQMGHIQANPYVPGEVMYCHETGGDAPQRMWITRSDGSENRPLYKETPDEWVTHEAWVDKDHVYFVVMAHEHSLRTKPTGIFSINVRTDEVRVLGQVDVKGTVRGRDGLVDGQGFWHCNGSPDGKWAVGDTFAGNVYLIYVPTGEITLLTAGHKDAPDHPHPSFSPDSKQIEIESGILHDFKNLNLLTITIPFELQRRVQQPLGQQ
jgi:oligogalacturonide lyase